MGALPPEGIYLLIARIATAYYFIHFLIILPILSRKEKTLNVPLSITDPVLTDSTNQSLTKEQTN